MQNLSNSYFFFSALSNHLSQNAGGGQASVPIQNVSIQITLPAQQGVPGAQPRAITIQVPASALQGCYFI